MKKTVLIIILFALGFTINAQITYVNINATGANNGTSWADAYTDLHSATFNTTSGEIWVAAGTYVPTKSFTGNIPANNRQKTFRIQYNVQVYGGFNGTETLLSERNWRTNVTTLSANVGGGLFAYNIVRFDGNNNTSILDGFTISDGQAGGTGIEVYGGAIYLANNASPIIRNCKFINNTANQSGGAIYGVGGSPEIMSCEFRNNGTTVFDGGAIYFSGATNLVIGNSLFYGNHSNRHAGAILALNSTNTKIYNNTFISNIGGSGGTGNVILISNTTTSSATVKNSIFYNNSPNTHDVTYNSTATLSIQNCLVTAYNGTSTSNIIGGNPQFVDFNNGDYTLICTSPAVNAGDVTGITLPSTDLNGAPRTFNTVDIGAYENQTTTIGVSANKTVVCQGDYVILRGSCDNSGYTWSNGVTDNVAFYPTTTQTYTCTGNSTASTATITIEVVTIANENLSGPTDVCRGDNAVITLANSANGAQYYLRDNSTDYIVDGPITGTGSAITFTTNPIYATTTYNVIGATNGQITPIADNAIDFDGNNDKITSNYLFPTTSNLSLEAWIYPEATTYSRIITNFSGSGSNTSDVVLDTYNTTNNGRGLRFLAGMSTNASIPNVLTLNAWNHVAVTYNSGVINFYVNGLSVGTFTVATTTIVTNATRKLTIGEDYSTGSASEFFNGKIDEVRIWNRTLTQSEIAANMNNCLTGNQDSLKVYYRMNEGSGNVINDLSGNGNNGTLVTGDAANHWVSSNISCASTLNFPSALGKALDFDGINDVVTTTFQMPAASTFSFEGWVFPRSTNYDRLFSNYSTPVNGAIIIDTYNATNNGTALRFNVYGTGNTIYTVGSPNVLTLNAWNHIACTFNNGVMTTYVNGFEAATGTAPFTSIPQIATYLTFGEDYVAGTAENLNGKLDEIRVWNKALSQSEIMASMNTCLTGTETGLLAYYNFEDGAGTVVSDVTINQNNGVMQLMDAATDWVDGQFSCEMTCSQEMTQTVTINATTINKTTTVVFDAINSNQAGATYQWLNCNNSYAPISGATAQSFTPTVNGNYAVAVTLNSCTDTSACVAFNSVSIKSLGTEAFSLFPNPTSNNLTIKSNELIEKIEVYNMLGALVLSETKTNFSVAELPAGIYILQVKTAKGKGTTRFVKE